MLPAQAGVIPLRQLVIVCFFNAPRAGGGDPETLANGGLKAGCSPRRRG